MREPATSAGMKHPTHTGKVVTTVAGQIPTKGQSATGPKKTPAKRTPAKRTPAKATAKTPAKTAAKAPGKAVAKVEKSEFTPAKAKAHTEKLRKSGDQVFDLVKNAYFGRIWLALGHKTWDEYLDAELGGFPLVLPREKKRAAVVSLAQAGMSTRAIAAATGEAQTTVARHIRDASKEKPSEPNGSPEVIDAEVIPDAEMPDGEAESAPEPRTVTGLDGRTTTVTAKEPTVINIVSVARTLAKEVDAVRIRLESLLSRDDYEDNKVDVQGTLETAVGDFIDTLVEEFADLVTERAPVAEPEPEPV